MDSLIMIQNTPTIQHPKLNYKYNKQYTLVEWN